EELSIGDYVTSGGELPAMQPASHDGILPPSRIDAALARDCEETPHGISRLRDVPCQLTCRVPGFCPIR
ncbi:MAG: hypothetical protein ACO3FE_22185, partial [Planctomycetaceae bacterium]